MIFKDKTRIQGSQSRSRSSMRSLLIPFFLTGLSLPNIKAIQILEEDKLAMQVGKAPIHFLHSVIFTGK